MNWLRGLFAIVVILVLVLTVACSTDKTTEPTNVSAAEPQKAKLPTLYTARQALAKMEGYAQKQWAYDAMPVQLRSETNAESNGQGGRASVWRAVFASESRGTSRSFVLSGSLLKDSPVEGVAAAATEFPLTPEMKAGMFHSFLLKTDSDAAFEVAQDHGGKSILEKAPAHPVNFLAEFDPKTHSPMIVVIYGEDIKKNHGVGVVHGLTGNYLRGAKGTESKIS